MCMRPWIRSLTTTATDGRDGRTEDDDDGRRRRTGGTEDGRRTTTADTADTTDDGRFDDFKDVLVMF